MVAPLSQASNNSTGMSGYTSSCGADANTSAYVGTQKLSMLPGCSSSGFGKIERILGTVGFGSDVTYTLGSDVDIHSEIHYTYKVPEIAGAVGPAGLVPSNSYTGELLLTDVAGTGPINWKGLASDSTSTNMVATVDGGKIWTSIDSGQNWNSDNNSIVATWRDVTSDTTGQYLAACISGGYIWTSSDAGATWTECTTGLPSQDWRYITSSAAGQNIAAIGDVGHIHTSSNGGASWTTETALGTANWTGITSDASGNLLMATTSAGDIKRTTDWGTNWDDAAPTSDPWTAIACSADGIFVSAVMEGSNAAVYSSNDGGDTWHHRGIGGTNPRTFDHIAISDDGDNVVITQDNGIVHTTPTGGAVNGGGTTWTQNTYASGGTWGAVTLSSDGALMTLSYNGGNIWATLGDTYDANVSTGIWHNRIGRQIIKKAVIKIGTTILETIDRLAMVATDETEQSNQFPYTRQNNGITNDITLPQPLGVYGSAKLNCCVKGGSRGQLFMAAMPYQAVTVTIHFEHLPSCYEVPLVSPAVAPTNNSLGFALYTKQHILSPYERGLLLKTDIIQLLSVTQSYSHYLAKATTVGNIIVPIDLSFFNEYCTHIIVWLSPSLPDANLSAKDGLRDIEFVYNGTSAQGKIPYTLCNTSNMLGINAMSAIGVFQMANTPCVTSLVDNMSQIATFAGGDGISNNRYDTIQFNATAGGTEGTSVGNYINFVAVGAQSVLYSQGGFAKNK